MKRIILSFWLLVCGVGAYGQTYTWKEMHQGVKAFKQERYKDAELNFLRVVEENGKDAQAHFNLGDVYLANHNGKSALAEYERALSLSEDSVLRSMCYYNMGVMYHSQTLGVDAANDKQTLLRKAIELYKKALRANWRDEQARYNMVLCQKQLKDAEQEAQHDADPNAEQEDEQQSPTEQNQELEDMQQLLNLARQAELEAKKRITASKHPQKDKPKNW